MISFLPRGFSSSRFVRVRRSCPGLAGCRNGSNSFSSIQKRCRLGSILPDPREQNEDLTPVLQPSSRRCPQQNALFSLFFALIASWGMWWEFSLFLGRNPWVLGLGFAQHGRLRSIVRHGPATKGPLIPSKMPLEYKSRPASHRFCRVSDSRSQMAPRLTVFYIQVKKISKKTQADYNSWL